MPRSLRAYLWDIEHAAGDIASFTAGKQLRDYENDAMLRAAVERSFEIMRIRAATALKSFSLPAIDCSLAISLQPLILFP